MSFDFHIDKIAGIVDNEQADKTASYQVCTDIVKSHVQYAESYPETKFVPTNTYVVHCMTVVTAVLS